MGQIHSTFPCFIIRGCDIVLGVQWLKTLGPINWGFSSMSISFCVGKVKMSLQGLNSDNVNVQCSLVVDVPLSRPMPLLNGLGDHLQINKKIITSPYAKSGHHKEMNTPSVAKHEAPHSACLGGEYFYSVCCSLKYIHIPSHCSPPMLHLRGTKAVAPLQAPQRTLQSAHNQASTTERSSVQGTLGIRDDEETLCNHQKNLILRP